MRCSHCGGEMPSDAKFCPYCRQPSDTGAARAEVLEREKKKTGEAVDRVIVESRGAIAARVLARCDLAAGALLVLLALGFALLSALIDGGVLFQNRPKDAAEKLAAYCEAEEYRAACDYIERCDLPREDYARYYELYGFYTDYERFRQSMNGCTEALAAGLLPEEYTLESALSSGYALLAVKSDDLLFSENRAVWQRCLDELRAAFLGPLCLSAEQYDALCAEAQQESYLYSDRRDELRVLILKQVLAK